ncbi:MAG: hypothetical protein LBS62_06875 [Clostridiales bacterium]|jgi:hypothetical protein|nr:hypothetical protein [Clostridiales bacterium]
MKTIAKIERTDWFEFDGSFGCSQDWYGIKWRRLAGCGPTTAANIFYYASRLDPRYKQLYEYQPCDARENLAQLMNDVWEYITPTQMGLFKTRQFAEGAERYARTRGVKLACRLFNKGEANSLANGSNSESKEDFFSFIANGLREGLPLGFLNLSNGKLDNLHTWHWVNLLTLETDEANNYFSLASDEGAAKMLNMSLWFETTSHGGGIAAIYPAK